MALQLPVVSLAKLLLVLTGTATLGQSFVTPNIPTRSHATSRIGMAEDAGFTTISTDKYDIVKVDLDDGRDYPIYIGTGYEDEEGKHLISRKNAFLITAS